MFLTNFYSIFVDRADCDCFWEERCKHKTIFEWVAKVGERDWSFQEKIVKNTRRWEDMKLCGLCRVARSQWTGAVLQKHSPIRRRD